MSGVSLPGGLTWQRGTVVELADETPRVRSIILEVSDMTSHRPGQHVDIRLAVGEGRRIQRSYSIASAPEDGYLVLTVERLTDGYLSSYLANDLRVGDQVELYGPIGTHFAWDDSFRAPVLLIAGGPGIAPFRSILRHCIATDHPAPVRLLYSVRSLDEVIYHDELMRHAAYDEIDIRLALTHSWPEGWRGHRGELDQASLAHMSWPLREQPINFVCGPTHFVDAVTATLARLGHPAERIRIERFGG